jgi:hypothetical protein
VVEVFFGAVGENAGADAEIGRVEGYDGADVGEEEAGGLLRGCGGRAFLSIVLRREMSGSL